MASSPLGKRLTRPVCELYEWNAPPRSWLWPSFSDLKVFRTILSSNFVEARRNFSHDKEPERRIPQTGLTTLTRSEEGKSGPEAGPNQGAKGTNHVKPLVVGCPYSLGRAGEARRAGAIPCRLCRLRGFSGARLGAQGLGTDGEIRL